jgi:hypothetical protein
MDGCCRDGKGIDRRLNGLILPSYVPNSLTKLIFWPWPTGPLYTVFFMVQSPQISPSIMTIPHIYLTSLSRP